MRNLKFKQLNMLFLILAAVALALTMFFTSIMRADSDLKLETVESSTFEDAWILHRTTEGNSIVHLPEQVELEEGEPIVITHKVPEELDHNTVLFFQSQFQSVEVMIDNQIIYQYGVEEKRAIGKSPVPAYHMIPILPEYENGTITITLVSDYKTYQGMIPKVAYGNQGDVLLAFVKEHGAAFVGAFIVLIFGIVLSLLNLGMGQFRKENKAILYLGIFTLLSGSFCLCSNDLIQFFFHKIYGIWLLKVFLLMLLPIAYLLFVRCYIDKKKVIRIVDYMIGVYAVNFVGGTVLQLLGLVDYGQYIAFTKWIIFIGLLILNCILMMAATAYGKKSLYGNIIANWGMLIFMAVNYFVNRADSLAAIQDMVLLLGICIYVIVLLFVLEKGLVRQYSKKAQENKEIMQQQKQRTLAQLNPNFLFSAMNILMQMIKNGSSESAKFLFHFSKYLRFQLDALVKNQEMVAFGQELEYIETYLEIALYRMRNMTVEIEDKVTDFQIPFCTIEPFVENAVKHGLQKNEGEGKMVIRSYERKDSYAVQVIDTGSGFDPERVKRGSNHGISETIERLETMCNATVDIVSKKGKGTVITIGIPKE